MSLSELVVELYSEKPVGTLYHYTSLDGLLNIVRTKALRATEIRYFSDSVELTHTSDMVRIVIGHEYTLGRLPNDPGSRRLLDQFQVWLENRLAYGHVLFVACFTAQGDLLSQWRGYCPPGKGVSLGFDAGALCSVACNQVPAFVIGKCVYDRNRQLDVATTIVKRLLELAQTMGEHPNPPDGRESFQHVFETIEGDVLRVAALLKNPSFREEEEWRVASPIYQNCLEVAVEHREGTSTLVPFIPFNLPRSPEGGLGLSSVVIGPTPRLFSSMDSISTFLSKAESTPQFGILPSEVPYRTW